MYLTNRMSLKTIARGIVRKNAVRKCGGSFVPSVKELKKLTNNDHGHATLKATSVLYVSHGKYRPELMIWRKKSYVTTIKTIQILPHAKT